MASAEWLEPAWSWCAVALLQATLLFAAAWLAERLLVRRVWPELLALFWASALVRAFLPPELGSPWSVTQALVAPALHAAAPVGAPGRGWLAFGFALWIAGVVLMVALRVAERCRLHERMQGLELPRPWQRALEQSARRIGRGRTPRVATLRGLRTPAVTGLVRPTLLVPREWLDRSPSRADGLVLLHELAHLERGDLWIDELCALARSLLWFHPLAWLAARRIHALRELGCDRYVARILGAGTSEYRAALLDSARTLLARAEPAGLRGFVGTPNTLVLRLELLERSAAPSAACVRAACGVLALLLAACVLPMASPASLWRAQARRVVAAEAAGERPSCFALQAAALVLAADSPADRSRD